MDQEKVIATRVREGGAHLHHAFFLVLCLSGFTSDFHSTALSSGSLFIQQTAFKGLVPLSDNLMDREFKISYIVVSAEILNVCCVINIIDVDSEHFTLLEIVLHIKRLNPAGIQVVHDDFGDA